MTTFDFGDGNGSVPAHRHKNPDGSEGGWVADTARVFGDAQVYGDARVFGDAQVYGDARVYGKAQVYGDARVFGNAQVCGDAHVYGNAQVCGDAHVYGNADIMFGGSGAYDWTAMHVVDGSVWLRYGCEFHSVESWPGVAAGLATEHESQNAARYEALTLALVEFVGKVMPKAGAKEATKS